MINAVTIVVKTILYDFEMYKLSNILDQFNKVSRADSASIVARRRPVVVHHIITTSTRDK